MPPVSGFSEGDRIDFSGVAADSLSYLATGPATGILSLEENGLSVASLTLLGSYTTEQFSLSYDGYASTVTLPCFAAGTGIRTRAGEVKIEALSVGDEVTTLMGGGGFRRIRWLGSCTIRFTDDPNDLDTLPIRVQADAFATGVPRRDLYLSPDHAVFVAGALIPIKYLINGDTIEQVSVSSITYWHMELDAHDVVFAEGLPTESFLDIGHNGRLAAAGAAMSLHPAFAPLAWEARGCAPLVVTGPVITALHRQLQEQAIALRRQVNGSGRDGGKSSRRLAALHQFAPAVDHQTADTRQR